MRLGCRAYQVWEGWEKRDLLVPKVPQGSLAVLGLMETRAPLAFPGLQAPPEMVKRAWLD